MAFASKSSGPGFCESSNGASGSSFSRARFSRVVIYVVQDGGIWVCKRGVSVMLMFIGALCGVGNPC